MKDELITRIDSVMCDLAMGAVEDVSLQKEIASLLYELKENLK